MVGAADARVAVIGASGYGGIQIIRLLQGHPSFSVTYLGGERNAGRPWSSVCSFLPIPDDPLVQPVNPEQISEVADFAILSLPSGLACRLAPRLLNRGTRVVDLSADFRYRSLDQWIQVYAQEAGKLNREDRDLCRDAVYGLPEWNGPAIAEAKLVAAPGCFPTASLLPLLPFLKQGLVETDRIVIDAKTGTSGGGRIPKETMLLAEAAEAIAPYGVIGHRHASEIEQIAEEVAGHTIHIQFTPHLVPMVRGLLSTVYARLRDPGLTAEDCTTVLNAVYRHHPCVSVLPVGTYPSTKWARHTNLAFLSVQVDSRTGQLVLMSAIDNLIKGQAGQGVQCLNLMAGLPPENGLPLHPFYP
ncbi:N-acetyl-gamma-glutamyl-phosphate reductase [Synechococcus sp. M16CYN]|uniref:N-acetyl-gamma-glutamyl-phosphate reductase n=1 Tax=Synechococcus sp. M16CYN TaxID=3103139 RepID=UPI0033425803